MEKRMGTDSPTFDLPVIGGLLREAREGKGLTVEDVSKALFLRKSIILALESATWDKLPHSVYVKGYVTQYALYLKVHDKIRPLFNETREKAIDNVEAMAAAPLAEVSNSERPKKHRTFPMGRTIGYGIVALFLVVFFAVKNMERPVSVSPSYENVARTAYNGQVSQAAQGTVVLEGKKLMIACRERTWVRIVIDDTEKKEFMLNAQEMVIFTGKEAFDLLIGNAGGVKLYYNGNDTGFSGESGQVKRVKLP